jgi:hypothetical protein
MSVRVKKALVAWTECLELLRDSKPKAPRRRMH